MDNAGVSRLQLPYLPPKAGGPPKTGGFLLGKRRGGVRLQEGMCQIISDVFHRPRKRRMAVCATFVRIIIEQGS